MSHKYRFALAFCLCGPAWADFDPDAYPRYETCALCHGLFGVSHNAKFPHLGGQDPLYIEKQLRAFIDGSRTNDGGQMSAIVTELQPGDLEVVVEWFSSQTPPEASELQTGNAGAQLASDLGCYGCHVVDRTPGVPHLTAQHAGYLEKQMADFRDGHRVSPKTAPKHSDLLQVDDELIASIAHYLAALPR